MSLTVTTLHDFKVVDISHSGMLLESSSRFVPGQRVGISVPLNGRPVVATIEILRVDALGPADIARRYAGRFAAVDERSHAALQDLLQIDPRAR
jgi:hypothetical protein